MSEETRWRAVALAQRGLTVREVAAGMGAGKSAVAALLKKVQQTGSVTDVLHARRPRQTTAAEDHRLFRESLKDRFASISQVRERADLTNQLSVRSVRRRLFDNGLHGCRPSKKPAVSAKNRVRRFQFTRLDLGSNGADWSCVLFTDETKINRLGTYTFDFTTVHFFLKLLGFTGSDGQVYVRQRKGGQYAPQCTWPTLQGGGGSLMLWGCFHRSGVGPLLRLEGKINAERYRQLLEDHVMTWIRRHLPNSFEFQQDNAPIHKARPILDFFAVNGIQLLNHPPHPPSPIENLWAILKRNIWATRPKNLEELWESVQAEWKITPEMCRQLVDSIPRRLAAVIVNKGFPTKY